MAERLLSADGSSGDDTGIRLASLARPADGLHARLSLIADATRSLELQYYQWDDDTAGRLVLAAVLAAADRGVDVRLLVDDLGFRKRARVAAALSLHPHVEVRLFNPWTWRSSGLAEVVQFVREFSRLNRRMHNKLLVSDDRQAIVGGRNIADAHYGLSTTCNLIDHDIHLAGPVVAVLRGVFDRYWGSEPVVPADRLDRGATQSDLDALRTRIRRQANAATARLRQDDQGGEMWRDRVSHGAHAIGRRSIGVTSDTPGTWDSDDPTQVTAALRQAVDAAQSEVDAVTPFFVPTEHDVAWYRRLVERGVRVRLLTNSLASNPGTISNSALDERRDDVVRAGVELHELKPDAAVTPEWETAPCHARYLGLHAKLYAIDRQRVFLGSINLDPRSKLINTEVGLLVDDAGFAGETVDAVERLMTPENAWRVSLDAEQRLVWTDDQERTRRQPARHLGQRVLDRLYDLLPLDRYV